MNPSEILESKEKFVKFLKEKQFEINKDYFDSEYKETIFMDLKNQELVAIHELKKNDDIKKIKNHFLIDKGLTHFILFSKEKILFYRSYGEIRFFSYSTESRKNVSKNDKLEKINSNFNILFQLKDISKTFYDDFKIKRDLLVRAIDTKMDDKEKYLISQKIFDRVFFIYFLCHKGIVRFENNQPVSGKILFKILLDKENFLNNLYLLFHHFNSEKKIPLTIDKFHFHIPFLNGGLFRITESENNISVNWNNDQWLQIFEFLNSYHWIIEHSDEELEEEKILTPEILGHVYERSVVEWEKKGFENEVAESAGKSARKSLGVYYTPESVTDYICRNTISSFLLDSLNSSFTISEFLEKSSKKELEKALDILNSIKILDPACGSGAFLIKSADIVFKLKSHLLTKLDVDHNHYFTKISIITNNIFGVDILQGATEIAKLRLWLWLISSYYEEKEITPLPNIEYNTIVGDSLLGWQNENIHAETFDVPLTKEIRGIFTGLIAFSTNSKQKKILEESKELLGTFVFQDYIKAYSNLYHLYKKSHTKIASSLKEILVDVRDSIYRSINQSYINFLNEKLGKKKKRISWSELKTVPLHWNFDFGNIMEKGGFDIVVGNPPYVRIESLEPLLTDAYKSQYYSAEKRCDLYIPFIQKFYELINPQGKIGMIVQNQFFISEYGKNIKELITKNWGLTKIIDFTHYTPFQEVKTYSCIIIGSQKSSNELTAFRVNSQESLDTWASYLFNEDVLSKDIEKIKLNFDEFDEKEWIIRNSTERQILKKISSKCSKTLSTIGKANSPLKSGRDSILIANLIGVKKNEVELEFENGDVKLLEKDIWHPLLRAENIKKWKTTEPQQVEFFPYEINNEKFQLISEDQFKKKYPKTYKYLYNFKDTLLLRKDSRRTFKEKGLAWYSLHRIGVPINHKKNKIVTKTVINGPRFSLDTVGYKVPTGGVCGLSGEFDPFILGYLNSDLIYFYMNTRGSPKQRGYISIDVGLVDEIPIVDKIDNKIKKTIEDIVLKILSESNPKLLLEYESKLNEEIYSYFELTESEIKAVKKYKK